MFCQASEEMLAMRLISVLMFPSCWATAGLTINKMASTWSHRTMGHNLFSAYLVILLIMAPVIISCLVGIGDALSISARIQVMHAESELTRHKLGHEDR